MNPELNQLMQKTQEMQQKMQKIQQELENLVVTGKAGVSPLTVEVQVTGRHDVKKVIISKELMDEDVSMIQDLVAAAVNDANRKIEDATRGKMTNLTADLNLPADWGGAAN